MCAYWDVYSIFYKMSYVQTNAYAASSVGRRLKLFHYALFPEEEKTMYTRRVF